MTEQIEALLRQGKWTEARCQCDALLEEHPTNARLHGYLGLCFYRQGQFEEAIVPLRQATILDESFVDAGVKLVQSLDRLQRYEEALELAEGFLVVDPNEEQLKVLIKGLRRQIPDRITEGWQRSVHLDRYEVKLASEMD